MVIVGTVIAGQVATDRRHRHVDDWRRGNYPSRKPLIEASTVAAISATPVALRMAISELAPVLSRTLGGARCRDRRSRGRTQAGNDLVHRDPAPAVWWLVVILLWRAFNAAT